MNKLFNFIVANWDLILSIISGASALVYSFYLFFRNRKKLKSASTEEEKLALLNEIKGQVMGYITIAENLFGDIPKSGASKLLYVLNKIKEICDSVGIKYEETYWQGFIDDIINTTNLTIQEMELEKQKAEIIENIKKVFPKFIKEADNLFSNIPENYQYKIEYILKTVEKTCESFSINVFNSYDWRAYAESFYTSEVTA